MARLRRDDDYDRDVIHAWQVIRIYVQTKAKKRLPELKTLLSRHRGRTQEAQTVGQQRALVAMLHEAHGGTFTTKPRAPQ